jgi:prepilin peptidase CpaA
MHNLALAAAIDLQHRRIPNALTFSAIIYGLIYHSYLSGLDGFFFSSGGTLLGLGLLLLFYILGMMGAGDVKLMGAVGSILGPAGVFNAFLYTAIVGGIYALMVLAYHGQLVGFMKRIVLSLKLSHLSRESMLMPNEEKASPVLCYGIAIAIGTSLSLVF